MWHCFCMMNKRAIVLSCTHSTYVYHFRQNYCNHIFKRWYQEQIFRPILSFNMQGNCIDLRNKYARHFQAYSFCKLIWQNFYGKTDKNKCMQLQESFLLYKRGINDNNIFGRQQQAEVNFLHTQRNWTKIINFYLITYLIFRFWLNQSVAVDLQYL